MNIKYSILWFEDDDMKFIKPRIEEYLTDLGFIPEINKKTNLEGVENIKFDKYNLILLDYHLDDKQTTDFILDKLQQMDYFSEILFYSDKENFEELIKKDIKKFQGVFWQYGRENLVGKIINVIDLTLRKFQDLNNLRGLVMAETSDLDKLKKEIFSYYLKLSHPKKEQFISDMCKRMKESTLSNFKKIMKYNGKKINVTEEDLTEAFEKNELDLIDEFFFDFDKKSRCIPELIKFIESSKEFDYQDYKQCIINKRNDLAHKPEIERDGFLFFGDLQFNEEECKLIRTDIKKYKDLLESLLDEIKNLKSE